MNEMNTQITWWHKSEKANYDLCPYFLVGKYICQSKNKLPQEK